MAAVMALRVVITTLIRVAVIVGVQLEFGMMVAAEKFGMDVHRQDDVGQRE
jgi:hypothetical protein